MAVSPYHIAMRRRYTADDIDQFFKTVTGQAVGMFILVPIAMFAMWAFMHIIAWILGISLLPGDAGGDY